MYLTETFVQGLHPEELQMIAELCIKHDALCISDEVYEWLTYDGAKHVKIGEIQTELNGMHTQYKYAILI